MDAAPRILEISRPFAGKSIFQATGPTSIVMSAIVDGITFPDATPVELPDLVAGTDYAIRLVDGTPVAFPCMEGRPAAGVIGGFHFAPGGNATGRSGGDTTPAINPLSIWDAGFRPACSDPRGMVLVEALGKRFWCDIYLLGTEHRRDGTSRFGATIADGRSLPTAPDGEGKAKKLDYPTAVAIYARHGKTLLGAEEFFAIARGVTERSAIDGDPVTTKLDAARTSRVGIMQATGNMWVWGTDGDPDEPRPSIFGGSWFSGVAGSRCAYLGFWPVNASDDISARGRCDHLQPDAGAKAPA